MVAHGTTLADRCYNSVKIALRKRRDFKASRQLYESCTPGQSRRIDFCIPMPFDLKACRQALRKLDRQTAKLGKEVSAENIHNFRTSSRRVETILENLSPDPDRNTRKLLKILSGLRRKAGRVRDLEVQTASLKNLKITRELRHKTQLIRSMHAEHAQRQKKFLRAFASETQRELRRRLKRVLSVFQVANDLEPVILALQDINPLARQHAPLTQQTLHRYRIAGKRARYLAELAENKSEAKQLVSELKRMQDVIGDWHDWLQLSERAAEMFGGEQNSALVAALRNSTRAKFRDALNVLAETRRQLFPGNNAKTKVASGRKPSVSGNTPDATAAA